MIEVTDAVASYDGVRVLDSLSFGVTLDQDIVAVFGPNGAGKSTLLKVLSGLHPIDSGTVRISGTDIGSLSPTDIVHAGLVHVPEERNLFQDMTVEANLEMGAYTNREGVDERKATVYDLFPVLREKATQRAGSLSGGQQQMLAIGRGVMADPTLLALDEPSEGLAPQVRSRLFDAIEELGATMTVLLVEQRVESALALCDHAYLLKNGTIAADGSGPTLRQTARFEEVYL